MWADGQWILLGHAWATWAMTGVIWIVQIVHYPLFAQVGRREFAVYEREHVRRIGAVVGPLMLAELVTGAALLALRPEEVSAVLVVAGLGLLAVIWLSTILWQMPQHDRLNSGFDPQAHAALVRGNWLRTAAWTLRSALVAAMLAMALM